MDFGLSLMPSFLLVGFSLGVAHALDADHLLAVSSLAARRDSRGATLRYAALWAMGHGGLLVMVATAILMLDWSMPPELRAGAERLIGVVLIAAGVSLAWSLLSRREPATSKRAPSPLRERVPILVGILHGLAGSAAMLALIPVSLYEPVVGVAYALLFSVGVLVGMMGFGLLFDRVQLRLGQTAPALHRSLHLAVSTAAVLMGLFWLMAA